ncbi:MAG: CHY zinc finger protein [Caulobacteraceae bacterium]
MSEIHLSNSTPVHGRGLDGQTRCAHWRGPLDIIAIRMRCCRAWWACRACHDELAGHAAELWPVSEWDEAAVLCGACGAQMSVTAYLACASRCPACEASFNPGCKTHHHLYFALQEGGLGDPRPAEQRRVRTGSGLDSIRRRYAAPGCASPIRGPSTTD